MVGINAFVYITLGNHHIFEVPPSIEPDLSVEANPTSPMAALRVNFLLHFLIKVNQPLELKILV